MNPFRLLVVALVAAALLSVFFGLFLPLFEPPGDSVKKISGALQIAMTREQQIVSVGVLELKEGDSFSARAFAQSEIDVAFECTTPAFCCDIGIQCPTAASWTPETISFASQTQIPAFVRCQSQGRFFGCTVFFGQKPAQLAITDVSSARVFDLAVSPRLAVSVSVQNTGDQTAFGNQAELAVYEINEQERILRVSRQQNFSDLNPGQTNTMVFDFVLNRQGFFEADIKISADKAGGDAQTISFETRNVPANPCRALADAPTQKAFDLETGQCKEKFFCSNCTFAFQCLSAWQSVRPETVFVQGDFEHAVVLTPTRDGRC